MGSSASEFRLLGMAAAFGGLLLMMFAGLPPIVSAGWGLVGLVVFAASRLVRHRKPEPAVAPREVAGKPADAADTMRESEAGARREAVPADVHAALQRTVRLTRPPNPMLASSVLPRSRVARSPSTP